MVRALALALGAAVGLWGASLEAQDVVLGQMYGQGVHAFFAGDYVEAHRLLTAAIDAGSKDPRVYYYRGLCLMALHRPEQVPADFQRGAELESSEEGRTYNVGRALERVQGRARLELEKYRVQARLARLAEEQRLQQMRFEALRKQQAEALKQQQPGATEVPGGPMPKPIEPGDTDPFSAPKIQPAQPAAQGETVVESPPQKPPAEEPKPPATEPQPPQPQPAEPTPEPAVEPAPAKQEPGKPGVIDPFDVPSQPQPPKPDEPEPSPAQPAMPAEPAAEPGTAPSSPGGTSVLGALRNAVIKAAAGEQSGKGSAPNPGTAPVPPPVLEEPMPPAPPSAPAPEEPVPPAPKQPQAAPSTPQLPPAASDDPFSVPVSSKPSGPMKPSVEDPFSLEPPAPKAQPSGSKPANRPAPPADPFQ